VEDGPPEELLARDSLFRILSEIQEGRSLRDDNAEARRSPFAGRRTTPPA
jgi:hypothetical protein